MDVPEIRSARSGDVRIACVAGSRIEFAAHGGTELKALPGEWELYAVR